MALQHVPSDRLFGRELNTSVCPPKLSTSLYTDLASEHISELYPYIIYGTPRLMDLPPGAIIGNWAYSVPGQVRYILDRSLEVAPGVLPADLARAWVRAEYELPLRRRKNQLVRSYTAPLHARPGKYGTCSYVDIKGAYLKILGLGYDVEYILNRYLGAAPRAVPNEIAKNKFSYAIAVAMSSSPVANLDVMGREGVFTRHPMNLYSNPCLFNLAQDTLNAIGSEMLSVLGNHVKYANTDGYIIEEGYDGYALDIIQSWGFEASIKAQGETTVYGVGSYKCGDVTTARRDSAAQDFTSRLMDRPNRLWLKRRWQKWADVT